PPVAGDPHGGQVNSRGRIRGADFSIELALSGRDFDSPDFRGETLPIVEIEKAAVRAPARRPWRGGCPRGSERARPCCRARPQTPAGRPGRDWEAPRRRWVRWELAFLPRSP